MNEKLQLPECYQKMFAEYAENSGQTELTAFANLMDLIQLTELSAGVLRIAIEEPGRYLEDAEGMDAQAVLQFYMDSFGQDNVGATIRGYYNPERLDSLLLELEYDAETPLWELLALFQYRIPSMNILPGQILELFYVSDILSERTKEIHALFDWFTDPDREDDGFGRAGYYEALSIYEESEDDEFFTDES